MLNYTNSALLTRTGTFLNANAQSFYLSGKWQHLYHCVDSGTLIHLTIARSLPKIASHVLKRNG